MISRLGQFFATMFSASDEVSFGRFASLLTLLFCLGWDTSYIVFVMRHFAQFHFASGDLLAYGGILMSQGAFCGLFYGVNKVTGIFNRGDRPPNQ